MDPVGFALCELDSFWEELGNRELFKGITRHCIGIYDVSGEVVGFDLESWILRSIFALFLSNIFYQIWCVHMKSFYVFSGTFTIFSRFLLLEGLHRLNKKPTIGEGWQVGNKLRSKTLRSEVENHAPLKIVSSAITIL